MNACATSILKNDNFILMPFAPSQVFCCLTTIAEYLFDHIFASAESIELYLDRLGRISGLHWTESIISL